MSAEGVILTFYLAVMPLWVALSFQAGRRGAAWRFTPRWHSILVPVFRAFFLVSLPLELLLAERPFILPLFVIGALATVGWLVWRWIFLVRTPTVLPQDTSVHYNLGYLANLVAFALACHSFVCLVVMINVSVPMLLVRERWARQLAGR